MTNVFDLIVFSLFNFLKIYEKHFSKDELNEKTYQAHNDVEVLSNTPHTWGLKISVTSCSFETL